MFRIKPGDITLQNVVHQPILVLMLLIVNLFFNVVSNASFKVSANVGNVRGFVFWQVIGNLAGFITVLTLTGLLRYVPLHEAFAVTTGLAVIGVQIAAGSMIFKEDISTEKWIGAIVIVLGIFLISRK